MDDWREPGQEISPLDEGDWTEPGGGPGEFYEPAPSNEPHIPRGQVLRFLLSLLLCGMAGMLAVAGLELRQQTFLGWLLVVFGAFLVLPAVRLALRAIVMMLIAFNQVRQHNRSE
ncbi:MAG TPA: hypothetical protein PK801_13455 [Aggregatilineales bacterium]|nr:hypothetical protein [Chloroflexota bacterium]HOA22915.1 hypothetical protein [Aggregatilineales bacterium]HPV08938.1 hypothetical protein [Aggregatilineales bacterium]HQA69327.1 hypothetical protein [Aggregatilineales bacterium]HQE17194.1 hypothetical protein [Aggregatilineales bacterium]